MSKKTARRISSVIVLRWLETGEIEIFQDLGKLFAVYGPEHLWVTRRNLYYKNLQVEYLTNVVGIRKADLTQ